MMSAKRRAGRRRGFTLIELMVASIISLICLASALSAGAALNKLNIDQQDVMLAQTGIRLAQNLLSKELERAGAGFSQLVVDSFHQSSSGLDRPYLPISIRDISTQSFNFEDESSSGAVCLTQHCSLLTIYSGEVQRSLQITNIDTSSRSLTASGSSANIRYWAGNAETPVQPSVTSFLLVNQQSGAQCLIQSVNPDSQYTSNPTSGTLLIRLDRSCDLAPFTDATSSAHIKTFVIPLRATRFLTNGFRINADWAYVAPTAANAARLLYLPNSERSKAWQTVSTEMESLSLKYSAFNIADPTDLARQRIVTDNSQALDTSGIMLFQQEQLNSEANMAALTNLLLDPQQDKPGAEDSRDSVLMNKTSGGNVAALWNTWDTEKYSIPLLRRAAQIEISMLVRKKCNESNLNKCTSATEDLDSVSLYQVRNGTTRINPRNLNLVNLNQYIR